MAKNRKGKTKGAPAQQAGTPAAAPPTMPAGLRIAGIVFISIALLASLVLTIQHLAGVALPGCGPGSACALLANSVWGTIPVVGWPMSYVGLAWFIGLLVAWLNARAGVPTTLAWIIRAGVLASIGFITIMAIEGHFCLYCFAVHAANFALLGVSELSPMRIVSPKRTLSFAGGGFALATLALVVAQLVTMAVVGSKAEGDLADSTRRIIAGGGQDAGFTGRWRMGPAVSPIRIVMWVSYQCEDCQRIEAEAQQLMRTRDDISLSIKHFPMSTLCNPHMQGRNIHPNSCWAARAAEAAGILRGNDGFWEMHFWLFGRTGAFTDAELRQGLAAMGYDVEAFITLMSSAETLQRVQADIEEAVALGLHYTPFIFVNGVELRGWNAPNALTRMVQQVAATNPPALAADADEPPDALAKHIEDWRQQSTFPITPRATRHVLGNVGAPVKIVAWVDYQHSSTVELNRAVHELLGARDDVEFEFRHYPIDQACNRFAQRTAHPNACEMSRAAEAVGILAGPEAYWRMHEWLIANQDAYAEDQMLIYAAHLGVDGQALISTMQGMEVSQALADDQAAGKRTGLRSVPWLLVNGRYLPRWQIQGESILREVAAIARQETGN